MNGFETNRERVLDGLRQAGLADLAVAAAPLVTPAIRLAHAKGHVAPLGSSKLGGSPDLLPGVAWPEWKGIPQTFLGQIDLAQVAHLPSASPLPTAGLLSFFYDSEQSTWGFDPADAGSSAVLYTPPYTQLVQRNEREYPVAPIAFREVACFPQPEVLGIEDDEAWDAYETIALEWEGAPKHQLLGSPAYVQGDDMDLECQLVTNGLYCGDPSGYQDPRAAGLGPGAEDWRLLLQVDSDDELEFMWGDVGRLYFWIRDQDLRAKSFDKSWMILQCS